MAAALAGEKVEVPADLSGTTPFQRRVLETVKGIPRGEVRPYAWVAREAGSPKASRAVGSVMAKNPVPLVVPCHRVVRNDYHRHMPSARKKGRAAREEASRRESRLATSPLRLRGSSFIPLPPSRDKARKSSTLPLGGGSHRCRLQTLQGVPSGGGRVAGTNDAMVIGRRELTRESRQ